MEFPRVGLGTYKSSNDELKNAIIYAIEEAGYRHIDTAWKYGNQKIIGEAFQEIFKRGKVKREELWITSKLWNTKHEPEVVDEACRETLNELQLEYLDLYLIHHAVSFENRQSGEPFPKRLDGSMAVIHVPLLDTWHAMEKLVEKGLVRHIGVSNFSIEMLEKMKYGNITIKPFTNQVEAHLEMQQVPLLQYLTENDIWLTAYSPLGSSPLINKGISELNDPDVIEISKRIGKTPAQVLLRFLLHLSPKIAIIPKSTNPARIKENFALDFQLSEEDISKLRKKEKCRRIWNDQNEEWGVDIFCAGW